MWLRNQLCFDEQCNFLSEIKKSNFYSSNKINIARQFHCNVNRDTTEPRKENPPD